MKKKTKNMIFNGVMIVSVIVFMLAGMKTVTELKGGSGTHEGGNLLCASEIRGIVRIQRSGVDFACEEGNDIRPGDIVTSRTSSRGAFAVGDKGQIILDEDTEIEITGVSPEEGNIRADVKNGQIFCIPVPENIIALECDDVSVIAEEAVLGISSSGGEMTVSVLSGNARLKSGDEVFTAAAGEGICAKKGADGKVSVERFTLSAADLDGFMIAESLRLPEDVSLCFGTSDLEAVSENRVAEILSEDDASGEDHTCTVTVQCPSVLENINSLAASKAGYVPPDGMILGMIRVAFEPGESVFDVLKRVCAKTGIQLEYAWTPLYDSYYVEGINHLYEFDCGPESGWTYLVNGSLPNYGASSYIVSDGDDIVWEYTCSAGLMQAESK